MYTLPHNMLEIKAALATFSFVKRALNKIKCCADCLNFRHFILRRVYTPPSIKCHKFRLPALHFLFRFKKKKKSSCGLAKFSTFYTGGIFRFERFLLKFSIHKYTQVWLCLNDTRISNLILEGMYTPPVSKI
jgi:hypothetical protein